jgi:hypothetical protein
MIAVVLQMSLGTGVLLAQAPDAAVAWPASAGPSPYPAPVTRRRLVFAFLPSLTMGISPIPSVGPALFVGGWLPRGPWALGYQITINTGLADRYAIGILAHRHHITAMRAFGRRGRGFTSVGGGAAFLMTNPVVEAEGRVGRRFGDKRHGIIAAQVRVGWDVGHREELPMPQFGVVFGVALL